MFDGLKMIEMNESENRKVIGVTIHGMHKIVVIFSGVSW